MSLNIGPINTKLEDFVNLGFLFFTLQVSCCLSHNKRARTQVLNYAMAWRASRQTQKRVKSRKASEYFYVCAIFHTPIASILFTDVRKIKITLL